MFIWSSWLYLVRWIVIWLIVLFLWFIMYWLILRSIMRSWLNSFWLIGLVFFRCFFWFLIMIKWCILLFDGWEYGLLFVWLGLSCCLRSLLCVNCKSCMRWFGIWFLISVILLIKFVFWILWLNWMKRIRNFFERGYFFISLILVNMIKRWWRVLCWSYRSFFLFFIWMELMVIIFLLN